MKVRLLFPFFLIRLLISCGRRRRDGPESGVIRTIWLIDSMLLLDMGRHLDTLVGLFQGLCGVLPNLTFSECSEKLLLVELA